MGQKYCRTKDQKPLSGLSKLKVKMSKLGDELSKLVLLKRITDGAWGRSPQKLSDFLKKTSYHNAIGIHFARVLSYLKELNF